MTNAIGRGAILFVLLDACSGANASAQATTSLRATADTPAVSGDDTER